MEFIVIRPQILLIDFPPVLVQIVLIVCWDELILSRLSARMLAILLCFDLVSSLDLTVIFVQMLT